MVNEVDEGAQTKYHIRRSDLIQFLLERAHVSSIYPASSASSLCIYIIVKIMKQDKEKTSLTLCYCSKVSCISMLGHCNRAPLLLADCDILYSWYVH